MWTFTHCWLINMLRKKNRNINHKHNELIRILSYSESLCKGTVGKNTNICEFQGLGDHSVQVAACSFVVQPSFCARVGKLLKLLGQLSFSSASSAIRLRAVIVEVNKTRLHRKLKRKLSLALFIHFAQWLHRWTAHPGDKYQVFERTTYFNCQNSPLTKQHQK